MTLMVIDAGGRDVCMPQPFLELREFRLLHERIGHRVAPSLRTPKPSIAIFEGAAQATAGNSGRRSPQSG